MRPSIRRPSPALIVACIALLVALGGTSYATVLNVPKSSVGTPQLKRNAVKAAKIAPNAVRTGHVLDGSLLVADFKAGQIPQGPKGDKGDKGDPGTSGYQVVTLTSPSNSATPKSLIANCPAGTVAVGGGARVFGAFAQTAVWLSGPDGPPAAPTQWRAAAQEVGAGQPGNWGLRIDAFCMAVG